MASVKVSVNPTIIDWVLSHTSEDQIGADRWGMLGEWKAGTKQPTFNQIEMISKKCRIPLGYFFLETPPIEDIKIVEYRTVDSVELMNPSRDLIDTLYAMEDVQQWMKEYRIAYGYDAVRVVGSLRDYNDIDFIADRIRDDLGLPKEWYSRVRSRNDAFRYVRNLLKDCGILVMLNGIVGNNTHRTLNIEEFRAFALIDEWAPLIFINSADSENAKLFSLFHELSHVWLGENDLFNDRRHTKSKKKIETICNAVASELILPNDLFSRLWDSSVKDEETERIKEIAHLTKCSECVVARKALDHKNLSIDLYKSIIEESIQRFSNSKKTNNKGGDFYKTVSSRLDSSFVLALCDSITSGRTTYTEAFRLTNTNSKTFEEVISSFGGVA